MSASEAEQLSELAKKLKTGDLAFVRVTLEGSSRVVLCLHDDEVLTPVATLCSGTDIGALTHVLNSDVPDERIDVDCLMLIEMRKVEPETESTATDIMPFNQKYAH